MSNIKPQTLKGFRDFLPQEARKRQFVINKLKEVFELYGFEPLETPALEYEEILAGKYGEEGEKLMYRFEDLGKRRVAMRYDQTVPLARVVVQYTSILDMPFKRYQISPVWRADNTQKGRYREFLQCDIDTVGSDSPLADAEILVTALEAIKKLGFEDYQILVNDRTIFNNLGINNEFIRILDKMDKIGEEGVLKLINDSFNNNDKNDKAVSMFDSLKKSKPTENLNMIMNIIKSINKNYGDKLFFYPWLARGLDYYTGIIFEIRIAGFGKLSFGGGGRYDNLIGMFSNQKFPAVGFAFGFDRLMEAMDELKLFPKDLITTQVLVTIFSDNLKGKSLEICSRLRSKNINTEIYLGEIKEKNPLEKQLKYADQKGIPNVIIIGPEEVEKNVVTLKNLITREQEQYTLDKLLEILR